MSTVASDSAQQLVWRNTAFLVTAQVLVIPISVITNMLVARFLGPGEFGWLYLATTFVTFGYLFVEFGHSGALAGLIAGQRSRAGELLTSSLAWRMIAILPVTVVLLAMSWWFDYSPDFRHVLALTILVSALGTVTLACNDVFRGYERTDIGAIAFVAWKLLVLLVTVLVLKSGGHLSALLWAQAGCTALGALVMLWLLRPLRLTGLSVRLQSIRELLKHGWPFLSLSLAVLLQENVDAALLAHYATPESVGWHAAARKLIGLLVYPAGALVAALYPTLSRLRLEDEAAMERTAASALRVTVLSAVPLAVGCALFPELGVWIFNAATFGPTADNLRILSIYLLLVYVSMPLGSVLMASGMQRPWVVLQLLCVVISAALNPWLIPWSQARFGNGGLGVCITIALAEVVTLAGAIWFVRLRLFDKQLLRNVLVALAGGAFMALIAVLLRSYTAWLVAPIALTVYAATLYAAGVLGAAQLQQMTQLFSRR